MSGKIKTQPLKWHGGKSYLAKWIHELAPPSINDDPAGYTHRNIAYFGGGGEFWNWECDGISEAVNDVNSELHNFYRVLRETPERLLKYLWSTPFSSECFSGAMMDLAKSDAVCRATAFFIKYRQSRQGLGKCYATPTRRTRRGMNENVSSWLSAVEGLPECHERLRRVEIRNMNAIDFIDKYDHEKALFYLDPPYLHETRSTGGGDYEHEMSDDQHRFLLQRLEGLEGKFMLSGYRSHIYASFTSACGWNFHEKEIDNKASSKKTKPKKTECIWTNY